MFSFASWRFFGVHFGGFTRFRACGSCILFGKSQIWIYLSCVQFCVAGCFVIMEKVPIFCHFHCFHLFCFASVLTRKWIFNLISCLFFFLWDCWVIDSARFSGLWTICGGKEEQYVEAKGFWSTFWNSSFVWVVYLLFHRALIGVSSGLAEWRVGHWLVVQRYWMDSHWPPGKWICFFISDGMCGGWVFSAVCIIPG